MKREGCFTLERLPFVLPLLVVACSGDQGERTIRLELLPQPSCGVSTRNYDSSCVKSLQVRIVDSGGAVLESQCTELTEPLGSIHDYVSLRDVFPVLDGVEIRSGVRVEWRGYHAVGVDACVDLSDTQLMFWGRSEPVDLASVSKTNTPDVIELPFECRPSCDCGAIDEAPESCPVILEPGICAPLKNFRCRRSCSDGKACQGSLTCDAELELCLPEDSALCAECDGSEDCDSGICVENSSNGESFCSQECPTTDSAAVCPAPTSCHAPGSVFTLVP